VTLTSRRMMDSVPFNFAWSQPQRSLSLGNENKLYIFISLRAAWIQ
jgi:hypothetical protein